MEFALIAPMLFAVTFGVMEVGTLLTASTLLEGAVREGARAGITGYAPSGTSQADYVLSVVRQHATGLLDPNRLTLSTKVYNSFSEIQSAPASGQNGLGTASQIVLYTLTYQWDFLGGYGQILFGVPNFNLSASLAVRNEPY